MTDSRATDADTAELIVEDLETSVFECPGTGAFALASIGPIVVARPIARSLVAGFPSPYVVRYWIGLDQVGRPVAWIDPTLGDDTPRPVTVNRSQIVLLEERPGRDHVGPAFFHAIEIYEEEGDPPFWGWGPH